jgi:hypothetical protein
MPRAAAPHWKRRKEPITDDLVLASVNAAGGTFDPATGHYARLRFTGCASEDRAREIKQSLFRCAAYLKFSMSATVHRSDDKQTWYVEYVAIDKRMARAYVLATYGPDRSKWSYDPRKKGKTE